MKVIKRIVYAILGVFALLCVFVLICALNPEISDSVASFLYDKEETEQGKNLTALEQPNLHTPQNPGEENGVPQEIIPIADLLYPFLEQDVYLEPEVSSLSIPKKVLGRNGFLPMQETRQETDTYTGGAGLQETGEGLSFDTRLYPYYGMLDDNLRAVYRQVYANAQELIATFEPVAEINASQAMTVMEAVYSDQPQLFWLDNSFSYVALRNGKCVEMTLAFNRTADSREISRSSFLSEANEVISGALRYTTDYDKEKYVHDAIAARVDYSLSASLNQSAYSALVQGESVCAGYARAFQYILQQLDIPCYYVTGHAGENHAWNIVQLEDEYYNVDLTWDDTGSISYDYFNKTDADFSKNHVRTGLSIYLPACSGTKYRNVKAVVVTDDVDSSGNTDKKDFENITVVSGPDADYSGAVLQTLQAYYDNCFVQLLKGRTGTIKFNNVVTPTVLEALYAAYDKEEYTTGYMDRFLKEVEEDDYTIQIEMYPYTEGNYFLEHTITLR